MSARNTRDSYGSVAKFFHWTIALLIIFMLILGLSLHYVESHPVKIFLINIHRSTGISILLLMVLRVFWRYTNVSPELPPLISSWQAFSARASHLFLYLLAIAMPLSGQIMSTAGGHPTKFWWMAKVNFPWVGVNKPLSHLASNAREIMAQAIFALLLVHVAAAIKHHVIDKDNILQRMMPYKK